MNEKADPQKEMTEPERKKLLSLLVTVLRAVHASLLASLKSKLEVREKRVLTPVEWFNVLSADPNYAWVRELTTLMSDLDALLDNREKISTNDFAVVREALEHLFGEIPGEFKNRYFDALAADSDLIIPNATLSRVLRSWPVATVDGERHLIRREWHISERRLAHLQTLVDRTTGGSLGGPTGANTKPENES